MTSHPEPPREPTPRFAPPNAAEPPPPPGPVTPSSPTGTPRGPYPGSPGVPGTHSPGAPAPAFPGAPAPPPPGYAQGTFHAPGVGGPTPPARPLDPLAAASLPAALAGPVGVGLGIAGLVRTRNGRRRGRGLAWTGTVLGALVTAGGVTVGIVAVAAASGWSALPVDVTAPTTANAVQVVVGNCLERLPADGGYVADVLVVPCADEHRAQVVASVELSGDAFPGAGRSAALTSNACGPEVLGDDPDEGLERVVWTPTVASWADGDRTGLCLVTSDDPLTQDLAR